MHRMLPNTSLRKKLIIAFIGIALLPILLITIFSMEYTSRQIEEGLERKVKTSLNVAMNSYQELLTHLLRDAEHIAQMQEVQEAIKNNRKLELMQFVEIKRAQLNILSLEIVNEDCEIIARSYETETKSLIMGQMDIDPRPYLIQADSPIIHYGLSHSATTFVQRIENEIIIRAIAPVQTYGDVFGIVTIGYLINNMLAKEIDIITDTRVTLYMDGKAIASSFELDLEHPDLNLNLEMQQRACDTNLLPIEKRYIKGKSYSVGYMPFYSEEKETPLGLISIAVERKDIEDIKQRSQRILIGVAIIVLILAYITGFVIANHIANPLKVLVDGAHKLKEGKLGHQLPVTSRDEIGELTETFNEMSLSLEEARKKIQNLFEGFVKASVVAIEARDPTTSGHSFRVSQLTVELARVINKVNEGKYKDIQFSEEQIKEIRYASLLHDFGKVGVREKVLVKAKKLYPYDLEIIKQRFAFIRKTLQNDYAQKQLEHILKNKQKNNTIQLEIYNKELLDKLAEIDKYLEIIIKADEPKMIEDGHFEILQEIATKTYLDITDTELPLLTTQELRYLSIRRGSLDADERKEIESHVSHSYDFLIKIPWIDGLDDIPHIAYAHHEKLNGEGYPRGLDKDEIPLQSQMMTIADIYDALTASDRPYKLAVTLERALQILHFEVKDNHIDPELLRLFEENKVYEIIKET